MIEQMGDFTVIALETATTEQLIAALMVRHRAAIELACLHLTEQGQVVAVAQALSQALVNRVGQTAIAAAESCVTAHPAGQRLRATHFGPFGPFGGGIFGQ